MKQLAIRLLINAGLMVAAAVAVTYIAFSISIIAFLAYLLIYLPFMSVL